MAARKTPPHPIRVAGRQTRTSTAPAFGKIPTFSHRLPARKPRSSSLAARALGQEEEDLELSDASDVDAQLEAVAAAQPRHADPSSLRTLKQSRRTASIYSVTSSDGAVPPPIAPHAPAQAPQRPPVYLRPDLSGHSGLSLAQLPPSAGSSVEALVGSGSTSSRASSRAATEDAPRAHIAVAMYPTPSTSSLSLAPPPSADYPSHLLPLARAPSHALPPYQHAPQQRETPAQRLRRLYLCPWEGSSPRSARATSAAAAAATHEGEKALSLDCRVEDGADAARRRKRLILRGAAALVVLLLLVDLVVLNVRVFSMRDAYYDE
ncbi:hypothetical protein JCM10450v2_004527 [Rhodotorula kratochvilovae]